MTTKSLLILSALAAGGAFAADIPWDSETKTYDLGADDVITFSANQTINGDYTFTGSGTIKQTAGELKLSYTPLTAGYPFINFAGRIVIENAVLNGDFGLHGEGKNGQANHSLGENSTLVLKNATFNPICRQSSNTYLASIVVEPGANGEGSKLVNTVCRSGWGQGAHVTVTGAISGSGNLDFEGASRKFELRGDNSGYSGEMYVHGTTGDGFSFRYAQAGSAAASFVHDRTERVYIYANTNEEIALGAFSNGVHTAAIDIASRGPVMKIGAREGTDSYISVPFITNPVTLKKVGAETTLTLAEGVAFKNDSVLDLTENANVLLDANGLSNVIVRVVAPTTLSFTSGVQAAIDEEGVVTLSCAEELAEGELRTARLGTIDRLVDGAYVGPTKIVVPEGVRFTLGRGQTINATIEGAGRFGVSDGQFWGLRNSTMTGFTGVLEFGPSVRVYPTMEGQGFGGGGAAQIVMKGAEISCGNETGAYLDKPFEIVEGTTNNIWSVNGNMSVGALTGKGYLTYNTSERRGPQLNGDNREFEGTVRLYSGWRQLAPPTGFYGNHAGSAKAVWLLQDDWAVYRDGNITYTLFDQDVNGDPIQFGAFCQTGANAWIRAGSTNQYRHGMKIEVGAREDVDSVINGKFGCSRIAFTKVGAKSCLMLGTGFGAVANSTFNFAEGTLGFNLPGADGAMTTLTSYGVTIAEGVKIRVAMTQAQYEALDLNEEYLVAKLPTNPGYKPETELVVDGAVLDTPAAAKWGVRFKSFPSVGVTPEYVGVVLCRRFAGLMIIVK